MKKIIKKSLQGLLLIPMLVLGVSTVVPLLDASVYAQAPSGGIRGGTQAAAVDDQQNQGGLFDDGGIFETITSTFLFIIGAVAVIMLIYGGFKYVTSGGDSSAVTSAKNTILYAVVGIVVALLAYAILAFVLNTLGAGTSQG